MTFKEPARALLVWQVHTVVCFMSSIFTCLLLVIEHWLWSICLWTLICEVLDQSVVILTWKSVCSHGSSSLLLSDTLWATLVLFWVLSAFVVLLHLNCFYHHVPAIQRYDFNLNYPIPVSMHFCHTALVVNIAIGDCRLHFLCSSLLSFSVCFVYPIMSVLFFVISLCCCLLLGSSMDESSCCF
jgi:hypothetical protein